MKWPFSRTTPGPQETRDDSATDLIIAAILSAARGTVAQGASAGLEIAAGYWQRGFATAALAPSGVLADALLPHLGFIGRELCRRGEAAFEINIDRGITLLPASTITVTGSVHPDTWLYELTLSGPSEMLTRTLTPDRVLHLRYAVSPSFPWRGISPIEAGGTTKTLLNNLEQRLAEEAGAAVGSVIPVPSVSASGNLQADLRALKGELVLVDSTGQNWGAGATGAPPVDYPVRRIGADPPEVLARLRRESEQSVLAACGVPQSVLSAADGTASREGFRQFLHATLTPIAMQVSRQIAERFDGGVDFDFDALYASDVQGRARGFQSLAKGGMEVERAARLTGFGGP